MPSGFLCVFYFLLLFSFCFSATASSSNSSLILDEKHKEELLKWEPPIELVEAFPYYLSGADHQGNPVWIMPFGQWELRWLSEGGQQFENHWGNYSLQMLYRMYNSPKEVLARHLSAGNHSEEESFPSAENDIDIEGFVLVVDIGGYSHRQFLHQGAIKRALETFTTMYNIEKTDRAPGLKRCFNFNANVAARSLWVAVKSVLGPFAAKFEVFGTSEYKWKPQLLRYVPPSALPKKYGGVENFKPIKVFGK